MIELNSSQLEVMRGLLQRKGDEFNDLLEVIPVGLFLCDAQGTIFQFNQRAREIWGRAPNSGGTGDFFCVGRSMTDLNHVEIPRSEYWMAEALRRETSLRERKIRLIRDDNTIIDLLVSATPIHDADGKLVGAVGTMSRLPASELSSNDTLCLAAIVESSDDAIISKTLDGKILTWNRGAERIFGYSAAEAIGQSVTMLIPSDRSAEEDEILDQLRRGKRIDHYETIRQTKDGRQIHVSLTVSPVRDSTGRVIGASKIVRDVTGQKKNEAALELLNNQLAAQLAELTQLHEFSNRLSKTRELQSTLDETLQIAVEMTGAHKGFISLRSIGERLLIQAQRGFDDEWISQLNSSQLEILPSGACAATRRRIVIPDISRQASPLQDVAHSGKFSALICTPMMNHHNELIGVLTIHFESPHHPDDHMLQMLDLCVRQAVDFIENASMYQKLQDSHRRKDEFLAILAHELRNPLAPISNSLQLFRMSEELSPSLQTVREIMEQQVGHMVHLVDDLLEVSRITSGKIELRKKPVNVATLIANAVEMAHPVMKDSQVELSISLPVEPLTVDVDPVRMTQVIANLLSNAAKYTDAGGHAWISASQQGEELLLSVRDTGVGISGEMLDSIFEMFSQIHRTVNRSRGGLGIGLTLARKLVRLHGGNLTVRSGGIGKGSEFTIRLPVVNVEAPLPLCISSYMPPAEVPVPRRRVLVVDDTRAAAFVLSRLLESLGQEVYQASDGKLAFQLATEIRPDIIFSDIAMPHMDGYQLARRIRTLPELNDVILVAVTGFGQLEDHQRTQEAGFHHHLVKPASLQAIRDLLSSIPPRFPVSSEESSPPIDPVLQTTKNFVSYIKPPSCSEAFVSSDSEQN